MDLKEFLAGKNNPDAGHHPWEQARFDVVNTLIKSVPTFNSVVDIGCGDTFFIERMARKYPTIKCYGIDTAFSDEIIDYLSKKIDNPSISISKNLDILKKANAKAGLVLLMDVVEHVKNDIEFISMVAGSENVDKDAVFVITAPAYQHLFCSHDKWLGHERRYNCKQLENTVKEAGLAPIKSGYFFFSLLMARHIQVLKEKIVTPKINEVKGIGDWKENRARDGLIKRILALDFGITNYLLKIGIKIPGLSVYVICRKEHI